MGLGGVLCKLTFDPYDFMYCLFYRLYSQENISGRKYRCFTILNYALIQILYLKRCKCAVCILNYGYCYTLDYDISFIVKLDGNIKYVTCICVLLKQKKPKRPKYPLHNKLKTKLFVFFFFPTLSCPQQYHNNFTINFK